MTFLQLMLPPLMLNMVAGFIIIGFIYYPTSRSKPYFVFTFFVFNILIFFIAGLLRDVQLTLGMGFGLLAVFSVLRFHTERMPIREMTFLFISISIPFINQLFLSTRITFGELVAVNAFIIICIWVLDRGWGVRYEVEQEILYEKIELIRPEMRDALLADIRERTGLNVKRCEILEVNFLRDIARIMIFYDPV